MLSLHSVLEVPCGEGYDRMCPETGFTGEGHHAGAKATMHPGGAEPRRMGWEKRAAIYRKALQCALFLTLRNFATFG